MTPSLPIRLRSSDTLELGHQGGVDRKGLSSTGGVSGSRALPGSTDARSLLPSVFAELPPRGLQAVESAQLARRSPLPVESRLSYQALASTIPMRQPAHVSPQEMPLAGYLLARALDGRKVEGKDFERLRRADESVREARALLAFGRGNVKEDNEASQGEAARRLEGARALKCKLTELSMVIRAIWAGAGNCGEHAGLTTVVHAGRLDAESNERVVMLGNLFIDHGWAESVISRPSNLSSHWKPDVEAIVLDTWKDGPAVFASDSTRTHAQWLGSIAFRTIARPQPELLADAKRAAQLVATEQDPRTLWSRRPPDWMLSNARTVVRSALVERVSAKPITEEDVLDTVRRSTSAENQQILHPAMPANVRREILAAGVARDLMAEPEPLEHTLEGRGRVRSAAEQAPEIIAAVGDLTKVAPRRHWPWIPSFSRHGDAVDAPTAQRAVRRHFDASAALPAQRGERDGLNDDVPTSR